MKILLALPVLLAAGLAGSQASAARPARCVIDTAGAPRWSGSCLFEPERRGSFTVTPVRGSFRDGIGAISLYIIARGVGEVRGLTSGGINSRWGTARRSARDGACWIGEDFSVCVY